VRGDGPPQTQATWTDASSYGVCAGVRFDDLSMIEFPMDAVDVDAAVRRAIETPGRVARRRQLESVSTRTSRVSSSSRGKGSPSILTGKRRCHARCRCAR